ncbi:DSCAM [Lepeophtheirus salmonis]|uniref:DSCAM n=1 Tax=Lepeophtheirus salmonis TaxID=72036 RepID=A0A7R8H8E6_LEPSM|nr:DSCAM [Lepeophtheirus salmonis]CAF2940590.1 DSCAM [Lepeophtheirus salmonis]
MESIIVELKTNSGSSLVEMLKIQAVVDEEYSVTVRDAYVIRGNTAILRCEIPSYVADYVHVTSWVHEEGTAIEIFPRKDPRGKYTLLQSGALLVHHTSSYDTYKKYICKTEHTLTGLRKRSSAEARIILTDPKGPVIPKVIEPRTQQLEIRHWIGEDILLPCVSQGFPVPESTWFKKMQRVSDKSFPQLVSNFIWRFSSCIKSQSQMQVSTQESIPCNKIVDLNRPSFFSCTTSGSPIQSLVWLKNGEPLEDKSGIRYSKSENGTLIILSVQEGDEGLYQCVIQNELDFAQATGSLQLGGKILSF